MQNGVFRTERRKIKILFKRYTLFLPLLILPVKYFMCKLGKWILFQILFLNIKFNATKKEMV